MPFAEWIKVDRHVVPASWQGPGLLKFIPPETDHSVWFFRDADDTFSNWYVNLEERAARWDDGEVAGVDVTDQDLDIIVHQDLTWEWKDEDELAWVVEHGRIDAARAARIRADGERAVEAVRAMGSLDRWKTWRPEPSWRAPSVSERWSEFEP